MNYQDAIRYLESLQSTNIKLGLSRIEAALSRLQRPQDTFESVIVAGTNGKGSTCAFLESIFRAAGLKTGLFISPHLVDVRERIQINREMISEPDFARHAGLLSETSEELTYFEFLTAMAFGYFAEEKVDIAVLEVGLGGRFDATNVVTPVVSVITRIGIDHQGYLGDTIEKIAFEKAGIIKDGVPVVTVVQEEKAMEVIRNVADEKYTMIHVVAPSSVKYKLGLLGRHQNENAALAVRAAELIGCHPRGANYCGDDKSQVTSHGLAEALSSTRWPGRLEVVSRDPLVILDGAHNPNGAEALARFIKGELRPGKKKITLLLGIMADKDILGIVTPLVKVVDRIVVSRPNLPRAASVEVVKKAINSAGPQVEVICIPSVSGALKKVMQEMQNDEALVIAGSLYMVGEVLNDQFLSQIPS